MLWRYLVLNLCLLFPCYSLLGQDPGPNAVVAVDVPKQTILGKWVRIKVTGLDNSPSLIRVIHIQNDRDRDVSILDNEPTIFKIDQETYAFTAPIVGDFSVEVIVVSNNELKVTESRFSILGELPPPPLPPDPGPKPEPDISSAPFPSPDGLRVLILEETEDRARLVPGHQEILFGEDVRKWLAENTIRESDSSGYRVWDDDYTNEQLSKVSETWRKAYEAAKEAKKELPWVVAANKTKGYNGPLPLNKEEFIKILEALK